MKKFQFLLMTIAAGLFLTFNSCDSEDISVSPDEQMNKPTELLMKPSATSANGMTAQVSGFGGIHLANFDMDGMRQFVFHANQMSDGSVSGNGVLTRTRRESGLLKIMFDIDCMIVNENTATMTGRITKWDGVPDAVGYHCWFMVVDNGEGSNADPDQISLFSYWSPDVYGEDCNEYPTYLYDIDGGNVQVK